MTAFRDYEIVVKFYYHGVNYSVQLLVYVKYLKQQNVIKT